MCGIWALFGVDTTTTVGYCTDAFTKICHRGPDAWRIESEIKYQNCCIGFHRLAIVDSVYGMQPMNLRMYPHLTLVCNGELYNCIRLQDQFIFPYETKCDVECIIHLFAMSGIEGTASQLDGVFAFCLIDSDKRRVYLARDTFGVRPAFRLTSETGVLGVCSEAKGLMSLTQGFNGHSWKIEPLPPGCFEEYELLENGTTKFIRSKRFHKIGDVPLYKTLLKYTDLPALDIHSNIRKLLTAAVKKRLMANRRIGCLLSGGLDSSLVAALLVQVAKEKDLPYKIQSFSIGMDQSPDIEAARLVSEYIGTEHHEVFFTPDDVRNCLEKVIYHLETIDITTVRASIGMYLVSAYIKKNTDTTVIFSGEGADEVAQGYIYFRDAPTPQDGHDDSMRLLNDLYKFDVLRSDRTTAGHSLEVRVPFLDHQFTQYYLNMSTELKRPIGNIEKYTLRKAFEGTDLLPDSILWRPKEAFSDGVTSKKKSLFEIIQEIVESEITDEELAEANTKYPHCTPTTKESYYYRKIFEKHFPGQSHWTPYFWMPRWTDVKDPSARFISHYKNDEDKLPLAQLRGAFTMRKEEIITSEQSEALTV